MANGLQFSLLDMTPYDKEGWLWLIKSYQQDYPYLPLISLLCSAGLLVALLCKPAAPRLALVVLALGWLCSGVLFQMNYHADLNWAAPMIGWVFIAQAGLLVFIAAFNKPLVLYDVKQWRAWLGLLLIGLAVFYPLLGLLEGRRFKQLEWAFVMPPATTFMTLGVAMLWVSRWRWLLMLIPLVWAVISAAFTLKLGLLEPYVAGTVVVIVLIFSAASV